MIPDFFKPLKYMAVSTNEADRIDVITSANTIASLAAQINRKLCNPVTIMWENEHGVDRDDNYGISGEIRPISNLIRYHLNEENDNGQFQLFSENYKYHYELLKAITEKRISKMNPPSFFSIEYKNPIIKKDAQTGIEYLEYHCPITGYVELLFSIMIDNVFMGAVCVGQILRLNDNVSQKIFDEFLSNHNDKFVDIKILRKIRKAELNARYENKNDIISSLTYRFKQLNDVEYNELINNSINCVIDLIYELNDIIRKKRERILRSIFEKITYHTDYLSSKIDEKNLSLKMIEDYEKILSDVYVEELRQFGIKNIRVLGLKKNPMITSESPMKLMLSSIPNERNIEKIIEFKNASDYSDYIGIKTIHPWNPICSIENGRQNFTDSFFSLFESNPNVRSKKENLVISMNSHMVMLYQTWLVLIEAEDINSRLDIYSSILKEFTGLINAYISKYELRLSKFVSDQYMLTLRLYRHECAQIASAIAMRNNNDFRNLINSITKIKENGFQDDYLSYHDFIRSIKDKNLAAACDDINENIKLILHMADTIGFITERINRENLDNYEPRSSFSIERDIITKWEKAHRNELTQRERNINIIVNNYRWEKRGEKFLYHRKRLIDMVIYNLIDNAL